ncbi:hypothetical protein PLICRDRAFT_171940 [Plicaturopsis crispa FD-325 SS-3]|nr:hypothetical protein PLICRDRAFT_171940 [Plicaturopsis crispa FD-325 SS-3]
MFIFTPRPRRPRPPRPSTLQPAASPHPLQLRRGYRFFFLFTLPRRGPHAHTTHVARTHGAHAHGTRTPLPYPVVYTAAHTSPPTALPAFPPPRPL